jgi:hypothetical protein
MIMADEKAQHTTQQPPENSNNNNVHGRIHNSQNPAFEQSGTRNDISSIDQQEGNMNNGECGRDLNKGQESK